jgi:hypothetical protein
MWSNWAAEADHFKSLSAAPAAFGIRFAMR